MIWQERREIEQALFSGQLMAVAATNALELGVDVGSLDITLHLGFPGVQLSTGYPPAMLLIRLFMHITYAAARLEIQGISSCFEHCGFPRLRLHAFSS